MLYSIVGMLVIILDQAVKYWVSNTLFGSDIVKFIPGVISLVNVHNDGAAFSFLSGSGARIYFIIVAGVFALLVVIALATNFISTPVARWSLVFVTAGALGNMIDRIMYGYVQDMFKVELFNFAIFNVADVFITVFAIIFALAMILEKPDKDDDWDEDEDKEEEDERPEKARKSRKSRKKEKPEEEETSISAAKKSRQEKYEKEYEEYKAQQRAAAKARGAAPAAAAAPARPSAPAPAEDPFAAWEKATEKVDAQRSTTYASRAMGTEGRRPAPSQVQQPVQRPVQQPVQRPVQQPVQRPVQQPVQRPVQQPVQQPVQPAAPVKKSDDFDLDDILAEFK